MKVSKGKERHNPEKRQNNYGGDYECKNFDRICDGSEFCHDETSEMWRQYVNWSQVKNNKLLCKGNRHTCVKMRLKWIASMDPKTKKKYESTLKPIEGYDA